MRLRKIAIVLLAIGAMIAPAKALGATEKPAWSLNLISAPTNFTPGAVGTTGSGPEYVLTATNVGGKPAEGTVTLTDTLPDGIVPLAVGPIQVDPVIGSPACTIAGQEVSCTLSGVVNPGRQSAVRIAVKVELAEGTVQNEARVEGGGALPAMTTTQTTISSTPPLFGFLPGTEGFSAPLSEADGSATTQAGSRPFQLGVEMTFPTRKPTFIAPAGAVHEVSVELPPGQIVNPAATPKCTAAQLVSNTCPDASQIGMVRVTTVAGGPLPVLSGLYNMVAPPGVPSDFGFNAARVNIFVHILGGVRSDGDYGLTGTTHDILAYAGNPIMGARISFWGDPASHSFDNVRGECVGTGGFAFEGSSLAHDEEGNPIPAPCEIAEPTGQALLTAPVHCPGEQTVTKGHADSWEERGAFRHTAYQSADLEGTPSEISGCNQIQYDPKIEARPTTNLADSPSGLDFNLHQPTDESLGGLAPGIMRDTTVVLPEGMSVNPASAQGQGVCTEAEANVHTLEASQCPNDSRLAEAEVTTPLLEVPLKGSVYLAKPFANPSGSLLAIYLSVDDKKTGIVANLAGEVHPDPVTGQLTTTFKENPQQPLEDIKLHFFTGPRASFRTPPACGTYSTTTDIEPWSAPETANAHPSDAFAIQVAPGGGRCPQSTADASNNPSFSAGTIAPQAGAFSPFVLKVAREDATQPLAGIDTTLPPGLTGKLAGIATCSEAQIAQAQARSHPNEGALELANPSCPASSEVGQVDVAAGAGITPLHTTGRAYLSGPYKGAPLSLTIITPAVAGPFDLGAVVVRAALHLDPVTTQIHAVSDPFPQILYGIPLDLRSVSLQMGRPNFTLNPTSCDPMTITGSVTSALGNSAGVAAPFQVGGCSALAFKPKLSIKLRGGTKRGGHPALKAILTMPPGGANISRTVVALPHSEFIDQGHFRTICTRVQFAAHSCPAGAIYGHVRAMSPLVDYPVEGPVYLRSSNNQLPDLVMALHGPPSQPIEVEAAARVDSVNGGIRSSFEAIPDLPISKVVLEMEGGRKGLFENSTNICKGTHKASASFEGQNGKVSDFAPALVPRCKSNHHKRHKGHQRNSHK